MQGKKGARDSAKYPELVPHSQRALMGPISFDARASRDGLSSGGSLTPTPRDVTAAPQSRAAVPVDAENGVGTKPMWVGGHRSLGGPSVLGVNSGTVGNNSAALGDTVAASSALVGSEQGSKMQAEATSTLNVSSERGSRSTMQEEPSGGAESARQVGSLEHFLEGLQTLVALQRG